MEPPNSIADVTEQQKEEIYSIVNENAPCEREKIEKASQYDDTVTRAILRELLYDGSLETTTDWKFTLQ